MLKPLNSLSVVLFVVEFFLGIVVEREHVVKQASTDDSDAHVEDFRAIVDFVV